MKLYITYMITIIVTLTILAIILKNQPKYSVIEKNYVKNPASYYWINRSDGSGKNEYGNNGVYLTLSISPLNSGKCVSKNDCVGLNVDCIEEKCIPYCNAEIYNNTCCDSIMDLPSGGNILTDFRKSLLKTICEDQTINSNCSLSFNPYITLDDPINQTRQAIKDTVINTPYLYSKVTTYITCKGLKNGSRGWGFWNTLPSLTNTAIAWFIQLDGGKDYPLNGFYVQCQSPGDSKNISLFRLPDLDDNEHKYDIIWEKDSIKFFIDDKLFYTETKFVPQIGMAYHNWVDNSVFSYKDNMLQHLLQNIEEEKQNIITKVEFSN